MDTNTNDDCVPLFVIDILTTNIYGKLSVLVLGDSLRDGHSFIRVTYLDFSTAEKIRNGRR
jgi:hypothetical protein